jgi:ATP-dependent DNA ligase
MLQEEIAHAIGHPRQCSMAEIVCLAADGRSKFYDLMFRRDWPHFIAFNLLAINGEDLRARPLLERKRRLRAIMPRLDSRLLYHDHIDGRGRALFDAVVVATSKISSRSGNAGGISPTATRPRG